MYASKSAVGSTDINRALLEATAYGDWERPTYLIFLTDGQTEPLDIVYSAYGLEPLDERLELLEPEDDERPDELLLGREDCEVPAICDIDQGMIGRTLAMYEKKGKANWPCLFCES